MVSPYSTTDPELKAHKEWLGYLQPVGLVVAPAAMLDAGWVVTRSGRELIERQQCYREALRPIVIRDDELDEEKNNGFDNLQDLLFDHLGWDVDQLDTSAETIKYFSRELDELGETLKPTAAVPTASGEGFQLLIAELEAGISLDNKFSDGEHLWRASAQERFERLLRETGVESGLLFNGFLLRLIVAPKGESSGHITFRLSELAEVTGRLMFSGLDLLLGVNNVFLQQDGYLLVDILKKSRSFQAVVSNILADQVLAALWGLLRGFQQADELSKSQETQLLGDLPDIDPQQLYGGLITFLMRLVFLLYAEDEGLMPADAVYEQNYKVSGIFEQLQQDAAEYHDTMDQRYGSWTGLMSLCRLVFDGGGASEDYLPARHGQLFDPNLYPWLETFWISDGVVLSVLRNLLIVHGERISYRALDVEQIGSVYEGIMGYTVHRIPGRCIGLKSKPQGKKKQITTVVDLDALLELPGAKRKKWIEDEAGTSLPPKSSLALKTADSEDALVEALASRINRELFDGPQAARSLVFQPTEERRRSGSHYTPRSMTRPIVEKALRPWMERCQDKCTASQILDLKICDPAMGSGAFLVESCRYLAELLEQAWTREGLPDALKPGGHALGEEPLIYARRLIAQSCLYGVDKNPFAVNLARLSLWLVSLSKDAPFTFMDHALKCGDSLVGMERSQIEAALKGASFQREFHVNYIEEVKQQQAKSFALFYVDSRSDADDEQKRKALEEWNASTAYLRTVGDLLVAAYFNRKKQKDREQLKKMYMEATLPNSTAESLEDALSEPLKQLREGEKGLQPLHWQLAFPDVFSRPEPGFDVFVGNPPFVGGRKIKETLGEGIQNWIKHQHPESSANGDLSAFFFLRCYHFLRQSGSLGLIATNTIAQGDTRSTGLRWICLNGGTIYSALKRYKWPGVAAVVVSVVHIFKGAYSGSKLLDKQAVEQITAFLFANGGHDDPKPLVANTGKSFQGSVVLGIGFTFDDSGPSDNDTPGVPSPIATMERLINENSKNSEVIFPYIGGKEVNSSPTHSHHRYVINFGERSEEECRRKWPELMGIVERKVKPERTRKKSNGDFVLRSPLPQRWWHHADKRPALYAAISGRERLLVTSAAAVSHHMINSVSSNQIFSHKLIVFPEASESRHMCMQSLFHEEWSRAFGATQGSADALTYNPTDVFQGFPFPDESRLKSNFAASFSRTRRHLLQRMNLGTTAAYGKLHQPSENSDDICKLRKISEESNLEVAAAYGWRDINTICGFGFDYLDIEDDCQLPDIFQERIERGGLFFLDADEAINFESQLRSYGALKGKKKLPWRYRWPDEVKDDVLARLLALNAERYAEEVAMGLHNKSNKRSRSTKAVGSELSEQMGFRI